MSEALYHDRIMRLARAAAGAGRIESPDGTATLDNPLCGDRVTFDVTLAGVTVATLAHKVRGCALCQAGAALLAEAAPGAAREEIAALPARIDAMLAGEAPPAGRFAAAAAFEPVRGFKSRFDCVRLPFRALAAAVAAAP